MVKKGRDEFDASGIVELTIVVFRCCFIQRRLFLRLQEGFLASAMRFSPSEFTFVRQWKIDITEASTPSLTTLIGSLHSALTEGDAFGIERWREGFENLDGCFDLGFVSAKYSGADRLKSAAVCHFHAKGFRY